jgi:hypothetical protein
MIWIRRGAPIALVTAALMLTSCERSATKAEFVDHRVAVECADESGEAYKLCRLEVIKKYMDVPLEEMQKNLPPPPPTNPFACSRSR